MPFGGLIEPMGTTTLPNFINRSHLVQESPQNKKENSYLLASYNKYGLNAFIFKPLILCSKEQLTEWEIKFYNHYKNLGKIFNLKHPEPTAPFTSGAAHGPDRRNLHHAVHGSGVRHGGVPL